MPTLTREDVKNLRHAESLPLRLFEPARSAQDAIAVDDNPDDGRLHVAAIDERGAVVDGSVTTYPRTAESMALEDAVRRARALARYQGSVRRRADEELAAWRARGGDAWHRGESGAWLKGVHHSVGPRWALYRAREDFEQAAGPLGYVMQVDDGFRAAPLTGHDPSTYATSVQAERALLAAPTSTDGDDSVGEPRRGRSDGEP